MEPFQQLRSSAVFDESVAELRVKFNKLAKRIACLLTATDELRISGKIFVYSLRVRPMNHMGPPTFEAVPQLDIFHAVDRKLLIEPANIMQDGAGSRYIACMVVREVHWAAGNAVRIEDSPVA